MENGQEVVDRPDVFNRVLAVVLNQTHELSEEFHPRILLELEPDRQQEIHELGFGFLAGALLVEEKEHDEVLETKVEVFVLLQVVAQHEFLDLDPQYDVAEVLQLEDLAPLARLVGVFEEVHELVGQAPAVLLELVQVPAHHHLLAGHEQRGVRLVEHLEVLTEFIRVDLHLLVRLVALSQLDQHFAQLLKNKRVVDELPEAEQNLVVFLQHQVYFVVEVDVKLGLELAAGPRRRPAPVSPLPVLELALNLDVVFLLLLDFDDQTRDQASQVLLLAEFDFVLVVHDPHDFEALLLDVAQFGGGCFELHFRLQRLEDLMVVAVGRHQLVEVLVVLLEQLDVLFQNILVVLVVRVLVFEIVVFVGETVFVELNFIEVRPNLAHFVFILVRIGFTALFRVLEDCIQRDD
eukprot:CAMPEP_0116976044 /NCGR_PEP_ID=MMETSP0467-20121206/56218_1 /TAXON_ID=283647 /ORGANISM="Mesodinium pulex, Strain SPMC105" /LENGTH=405 /DNA_ID=CAMNT_0004668681 /DNA_START=871 /DNA_END=2087 /DNA_ORIENTATION=-